MENYNETNFNEENEIVDADALLDAIEELEMEENTNE